MAWIMKGRLDRSEMTRSVRRRRYSMQIASLRRTPPFSLGLRRLPSVGISRIGTKRVLAVRLWGRFHGTPTFQPFAGC